MKYLHYIILLFAFNSCSKGSSNKNNSGLPAATVQNITEERADTNLLFRFIVSLNKATNTTVSLNYSTQDGTAFASKDYLPKSGTLTIPSGQTEAFIDIVVIGDSLRQPLQSFYIQLTDPVNCSLASTQVKGTIENDGTYLPTDTTGYETPLSYPGYSLIWSDEFNSNSVNSNNWNFETGNNNGWGNGELEYYTGRLQNVFQSCGNLIIEARNESYEGYNYTSTRMKTEGKLQFQYGRIDIRAKLPVSTGLWPALWMLGSNIEQVGWPSCGETDIMELIGVSPNRVFGSIHWGQTGGEGSIDSNYALQTGDFSQQFHVFSLIWKQDSIQILVDNQVYMSADSQDLPQAGTWPFNSPSFFILNVAVGGNWPGPPNSTTAFPQRMFIDYIRVFQ